MRPRKITKRSGFATYLNQVGLLGTAVEVGTHRGEFAVKFLSLWEGKRLWCVDPYVPGYCRGDPASSSNRENDYRLARGRTSKFGKRVQFMRRLSENACTYFEDKSLHFVYVDGKHTTASVLQDLECWWSKIASGGLLAGHDYRSLSKPGKGWDKEVRPAVEEFSLRHSLTVSVVRDRSSNWSYYFVK